ncbi:inactive pancreatic lipase-related protein 1-like [Limulus polyphemus]|uniref:Inactive pancreatic lipase-related protein 1-like n=1 Tax=Limulus polyphemus TaxID=6850 RepID=A0ABM1BYR6_LIMPO|nr:inactive pancreatic lipase-related protein 1-like [Limulus polyphemus]
MAKKVRLDRGDADFVDVIHTDSIVGLGTTEAIGHIDFYPNGGDHQPGCVIQPISTLFTEGVEQGVRRLFACDHLRSIDYYIEAMDNEKCTPVGVACESWKKYSDGECSDCGDTGQKCIMVGPQAETFREFKNDKKGKKFFFKTAPTKPYCMYDYQVQVTLAKPEDSSTQRGKLYVTIEGEDDDLSIRLSERSEELEPGEQYSYLVSTKKNPGPIETVKFKWVSYAPTLFDPEFWQGKTYEGDKEVYLSRVSVNPINNGNIEGRKVTPSSFCYKPDEPIKSNKRVELTPGECEEIIQ